MWCRSLDIALGGQLARADFRFGISRSLSSLRIDQHGCHLGWYGGEAGTPYPMSSLETPEPVTTQVCEELGFRKRGSDLVNSAKLAIQSPPQEGSVIKRRIASCCGTAQAFMKAGTYSFPPGGSLSSCHDSVPCCCHRKIGTL